MKNLLKHLVTVLVVTLLTTNVFAADYPETSYKQKFWDVPKTHWAFEYIADLQNRNVISGYEDGSFKPEATVSRAEWAKMMTTAAAIPVNSECKISYYTDTENHWSLPYIEASKDYLTCYADGSFKPDQAITREDAALSLVKLKGYDINDVDFSIISAFTDLYSISDYAKVYVAVAVENELISGFEDNTIRGQGTLTRAQAAALMYRTFQRGSANKRLDGIINSVSEAHVNEVIEYKQNEFVDNKGKDITEVTTNNRCINVLAEAAIEEGKFHYTADGSNIYYVEDSKIKKCNLSGDIETFFDLSELNVNDEEKELKDFEVYSICWSQNKLYIQGRYNYVNCIHKLPEVLLVEVSTEGTVLSTIEWNVAFEAYDGINYTHIVSAVKNGYIDEHAILSNKLTIDAAIEEDVDEFGGYFSIQDIVNKNNCLYYIALKSNPVSPSYLSFKQYDYKESKILWDWSKDVVSAGINGEFIVSANNDNLITVRNFNGKTIDSFYLNDCEVESDFAVKCNHFDNRLMIVDNYVVAYDLQNEAFITIGGVRW